MFRTPQVCFKTAFTLISVIFSARRLDAQKPSLSITQSAAVIAPGTVTVDVADSASHHYLETITYGAFSSAASLASALGASFTHDFVCPAVNSCSTGLGARATVSVLTFQLNSGASLQSVNVTTSSNAPFQFSPLGFPTPTQLAISSSANPSAFNQNVVFTVMSASSSSAALGSVTFYDGTSLIGGGAVALNSSGQATIATASLSIGVHAITATYNSGGTSGSVTLNQTVGMSSPIISSLLPTSGSVGNVITLYGSGLGNAPGSVIFSNGLSAPIISWDAAGTNIIVRVPAGATSGTVRVLTNGNIASQGVPFTVQPITCPAVP